MPLHIVRAGERSAVHSGMLKPEAVAGSTPVAPGRDRVPARLSRYVAEAAQNAARANSSVQQAGRRIAALPGSTRSRLQAARALAMREPPVSGGLLARELGVSTRRARPAAQLVQAGVPRR
jgi:hypothetical protein